MTASSRFRSIGVLSTLLRAATEKKRVATAGSPGCSGRRSASLGAAAEPERWLDLKQNPFVPTSARDPGH